MSNGSLNGRIDSVRLTKADTLLSTATMEYTSTGQNMSEFCIIERNWYTLGFQAIVLPAIIFNAIPMTAALINRKKLQRENCLFASVISTLFSNNIYLLMLEWTLFDNYFDEATVAKQSGLMSTKRMIWVFQEAFTIALPFLICGNIFCLTYVTVNSASYVGRVARVEDKQTAEKRFSRIRRNTYTLLATSWAVPIILTILGMVQMNCVKYCVCPTTNYAGSLCPNQTSCSLFWAPLNKSFLWINVALWTIAIFALCILLWNSISKYQQTTRRLSNPQSGQPTEDEGENVEENSSNNNCKSDATELMLRPDKFSKNTNNSNNNKRATLQRRPTETSFKRRLNPRLYFALILSFTYMICSACFVAAITIDTIVKDPAPNGYSYLVFAMSRIAMWLYTTACPIVMVKNLPPLKISLDKMYISMTKCNRRSSPKMHAIKI